MPKTITLTDVQTRAMAFTQQRDGTWTVHVEYAILDSTGSAHGRGELDYTPGPQAQTNITNLAAQVLAAAKSKEGL